MVSCRCQRYRKLKSTEVPKMEAGTARLRGRPHKMLRTRVVLDRAAAWTRLGVRVTRDWQPRKQRRGSQTAGIPTPPRLLCLLSRAANVRARAYERGHMRACVCGRACVGSIYNKQWKWPNV